MSCGSRKAGGTDGWREPLSVGDSRATVGNGSGGPGPTRKGALFSASLSTVIPVRSNCSRRKTRHVSSAICCLSCCSSSDCLESVTLWHRWLSLQYAKVKIQAKRWKALVSTRTGRGGMKFHTEYLTFNTRKHREYIHITPQVEEALRKSGVQEGMVLVSAMHITAGGYVNDQQRGPIC